MRKAILLCLFSSLVLFGCGGGGGGLTDSGGVPGGGDVPGGGGGTPASLGNVSVHFEPRVDAALIDTSSLDWNAVRLVATKSVKVGETCLDFITAIIFDIDADAFVEVTECNVPFKRLVYFDFPDGTFPIGIEVIPDGEPGAGDNAAGIREDFELLPVAISDSGMDPDVGGDAYISVPEGDGYTLHVLTYVAGKFTGDGGASDAADDFDPYDVPDGTTPAPIVDGKIDMSAAGSLNLLWDYGQSNTTFSIAPAVNIVVPFHFETDMGVLGLPNTDASTGGTPVTSGDSYDVTPVKSTKAADATRDSWYLRTATTPSNDTTWLIREDAEIDTASGNGTITVDTVAVKATSVDPDIPDEPYTIWNFGQFFISQLLLNQGENWRQWTYGTTDDGFMNTTGGVIVDPIEETLCGNGTVNTGEACDNGAANNDGVTEVGGVICSDTCTVVTP